MKCLLQAGLEISPRVLGLVPHSPSISIMMFSEEVGLTGLNSLVQQVLVVIPEGGVKADSRHLQQNDDI